MTALTSLRIRKRPRGARALAGGLLTLGLALTLGLVAGGGTASATTLPHPVGHVTGNIQPATTGFCHDPNLGGTFYCDTDYGSISYTTGETWWTFPNGTEQLFVIGKDLAVWTRWSNTSGGYSAWTSMGGKVSAYPVWIYNPKTSTFSQNDGGTYTPTIAVVGTNGLYYVRTRSESGSWSGWEVLGVTV